MLAGPPIVSFAANRFDRIGGRSGEVVTLKPAPPTGVSTGRGVTPGELVSIQGGGGALGRWPKPLSLKSSADSGSDSQMIGFGPIACRHIIFCVLAVVFVILNFW